MPTYQQVYHINDVEEFQVPTAMQVMLKNNRKWKKFTIYPGVPHNLSKFAPFTGVAKPKSTTLISASSFSLVIIIFSGFKSLRGTKRSGRECKRNKLATQASSMKKELTDEQYYDHAYV
jgi:hypothetical protein